MTQTVSLDSVVVATTDQVSTELAGKKAILHLTNRTYYTLDEVGSPIWEWIQTPRRVTEIHQLMLQRFDAEAAQAERDLLVFLQKLADQGLVLVK